MARSSIWLDKMDRDANFVVNKRFLLDGKWWLPGKPFDKTLVSTRRLRLLFETRKIKEQEDTPVLKHIAGGRYAVVQGNKRLTQLLPKEEAEQALTRLAS